MLSHRYIRNAYHYVHFAMYTIPAIVIIICTAVLMRQLRRSNAHFMSTADDSCSTTGAAPAVSQPSRGASFSQRPVLLSMDTRRRRATSRSSQMMLYACFVYLLTIPQTILLLISFVYSILSIYIHLSIYNIPSGWVGVSLATCSKYQSLFRNMCASKCARTASATHTHH